MIRAVRSIALIALAGAAIALTQHAHSHALWDPQGLVKPRSNRDDIKTGPCGEPRGNNPVTLAAGATVNLSIERTIFHRGYFRIAFSPANDQGFDDYVLADQVPENSTQRFYTVSVTLPDVECTSCTLQLIQVMLDRNPPTNYYSCADIRLVRTPAGDTRSPAGVSQVLAVAGDSDVQLNWTNPPDEDLAGVLIIEGDAPLNGTPEAGQAYTLGTALGNGTVVSTSAASNLVLSERVSGRDYYYHLFAFDRSHNYASGVTTSVTLTEPMPNLAPTLQLLVEQGGQIGERISTNGGLVTIQAQIGDPNSGDRHQLGWSASNPQIVGVDPVEGQFTFDPQALEPGEYRVTASVTDDGSPPLTSSADITFSVEAPSQARGGNSGVIFWTLIFSFILLRRRLT